MNEAIIGQITSEIEAKGLLIADGSYNEAEESYEFYLVERGSHEQGCTGWVTITEIMESKLAPPEAAALVLFRSMM